MNYKWQHNAFSCTLTHVPVQRWCTWPSASWLLCVCVCVQDLLGNTNTKPGDVMSCLIKSKQDPEMNEKCRAGIEHHQLLTLKDYRFSFKFKQACKEDVEAICEEQSKSKSDVVRCLSQAIRDDVLSSASPRVSADCRHQVTFQLLQRVGKAASRFTTDFFVVHRIRHDYFFFSKCQ